MTEVSREVGLLLRAVEYFCLCVMEDLQSYSIDEPYCLVERQVIDVFPVCIGLGSSSSRGWLTSGHVGIKKEGLIVVQVFVITSGVSQSRGSSASFLLPSQVTFCLFNSCDMKVLLACV